MNDQWMALALSAGLGLVGVELGTPTQATTLSPVLHQPQVAQAAPYNCLTREVWSPEKQAWCEQHTPVNPPVLEITDGTSTMEPSLMDQLVGTEWRLEDLAGAGVLDNLQTTLRFETADRIVGNGGCNRYFGGVTVNGDRLAVSAVGSTRRLCAPAVMNQEMRFFNALQQAQRITIDGSSLYLYSEGLDQPLRFTQLTLQ